MKGKKDNQAFVDWFRSSSPYINAHRGKTFVLLFGGEAIEDEGFEHLVHDIATLNSLGIRLVIVHGIRPQGVQEGVDYGWTGEVRRIDVQAINQRLQENNVVLLSPLGYSPTGEVFNLSAEDVAGFAAEQLRADKLIMLMNERGVLDGRRKLIQQLNPAQASSILEKRKLPEETRLHLVTAARACRSGVKRAHLIDRHIDGDLLQELFTRDGTLVTAETYETLRPARIDDVGGILELIRPFEEDGTLVRRSRERLETEISHFSVIERDGMVIGCAALYPFAREKLGELACLAVHDDYHGGGRGDLLLEHIEQDACKLGIEHLFVLTTITSHWFRERGFQASNTAALPMRKRDLYNYRRNSRVLIKDIGSH